MSDFVLTEAVINKEAAEVWKRLTNLEWDDRLWLDMAREQLIGKYVIVNIQPDYLVMSLDQFSERIIAPLLEASAKNRKINVYTLRHLADVLRKAVADHPAYGQGASIIINCCDHLCAVAAFNEVNARTSALQAELDRLKK